MAERDSGRVGREPEALSRVRRGLRRLATMIIVSSIAIAIILLLAYVRTGERGFLLAALILVASLPVDAVLLHSLITRQVQPLQRLLGELGPLLGERPSVYGGFIRGLLIIGELGGKVLLVHYRGNQVRLLLLNPAVREQRSLRNPDRAFYRILDEGMGARARAALEGLRVLRSCRRVERRHPNYRVWAPHPRHPVMVLWEGPGVLVDIMCPLPVEAELVRREAEVLLSS